MYRILLVCTGNICRSPTAEGVLRHRIEKTGLSERVEIDSAGTHGYHIGEAPDERSVAAARRRGIDISHLRGRQVSAADFERFDLILALDDGHLRHLKRMAPKNSKAAVVLFHSVSVPDPYYGNSDGFEHVLDLVEAASETLVAKLKKELK